MHFSFFVAFLSDIACLKDLISISHNHENNYYNALSVSYFNDTKLSHSFVTSSCAYLFGKCHIKVVVKFSSFCGMDL